MIQIIPLYTYVLFCSQFIAKVVQSHLNRDLVEQLKKTSPDDESPEQVWSSSSLSIGGLGLLLHGNTIMQLHLISFTYAYLVCEKLTQWLD